MILLIFASASYWMEEGEKLKDTMASAETIQAEVSEPEVEKKYIEFAETKYDKYSSELSTDEMIGITKLKATYLTIQTKHGIIDNILKEGNNALDDLIK